MFEHRRCPECDGDDTEVVHVSWFEDYAERVRVCTECPTQWTVSYGHPTIRDVEQYD